MKVLLLADADSAHTLKWVKGLSKAGVELGLFSLRPIESEIYDRLNIPTREMNYTDRSGWLELKFIYARGVKVLKEFIRDFNPDIVHAHYASSYGLIGSFTGFSPYVVSSWGTDVYVYPKSGFVYKQLLKRTLSKADEIIGISKDLARETMLYTKKQVRVIPWGIKSENFSFNQEKWKNPNWQFATAKSLRPVYNIPTSIKAFLQLKKEYPHQYMELHIAGDGPERSKCVEVSGDELNKSVFLHGAVSPHDMPKFYSDKHVLINIPNSESFGVSILEASLSGLAVVGTDAGGIPEVLMNGQTGILIPEPSVKSCYEALRSLVENREYAFNLARQGNVFVLKNFDHQRTIQLQKELYQSLIN